MSKLLFNSCINKKNKKNTIKENMVLLSSVLKEIVKKKEDLDSGCRRVF